jgi:hypothetical protein
MKKNKERSVLREVLPYIERSDQHDFSELVQIGP